MGYCISQTESDIFIAECLHSRALEALKAMDVGGCMWVTEYNIKQAKDLADVLREWGYAAELDEDGNLYDLWFQSEKLGTEFAMFKVLAPFVKKGSYLQMSGEEGAIWRWVFDGKECHEVEAKITWE